VKVAVLGAAGLLGRHVVEELRGHEVRGFDRRACDVSKLADVERAVEGAELVINCAGFTAVDPAETRVDEAYQANAIGAENLARAALRVGAKAVHLSTDFVFDGAQSQPYDEFDEPRPISAYGRSKWAGEKLFQRVGGKLFLVRVQGLYGAGGPNFSSKLRDLIKAGKRLTLDGERRVQPTWARSAARQIVLLGATDHYGTYHVSSHGEATWASFAKLVAESLRVAPAWDEVSTAALKAPAARPPNCLFAHRMLSLRGLDRMPDWRIAAEEYLAEEAQKEATEQATKERA
jgi:dTDP-4-dehydrorhamnose reductase